MMIRTGRTLSASCCRTVVVGRSVNLFIFWRRSMFASVRRPAARNEAVFMPLSLTREAVFSSPVMMSQLVPAVVSGWITPVLMSPASAWVTTS